MKTCNDTAERTVSSAYSGGARKERQLAVLDGAGASITRATLTMGGQVLSAPKMLNTVRMY